jgi:DUF971 family protein
VSEHIVPLALEVGPDGLALTWPDGKARLHADLLRAVCRCGGCRGAATAGRPAQRPAGLTLVRVEPAGAYGLQLVFSDGHDRGIYPWSLLRELAP